MSEIKAIIVEDEAKGLNNLKNLLAKYCPQIELIGEAKSIVDALELFADPAVKPDVAFMDISLPDGLVFQLIEKLRPINFEVIFVTAYEEFAIKACEYSSIGYIVKPIDPDLLKEAVERIQPKTATQIDNRMNVWE